MARRATVTAMVLALACGSPAATSEPAPRRSDRTRTREVAPPDTPAPPTPEAPAARAQPLAPPPDFDAPLPDEPCPPVRVQLAHASATGLPSLLTHAIALRSDDGRHVRVVLADEAPSRDELGRFPTPEPGHARVELDAIRARRGPLEPAVLGAPDAPRGGLTHARIVAPSVILTFGHRDVGRVELTAISEREVCGRVDLDDGFGRVRGAFRAPVIGVVPR